MLFLRVLIILNYELANYYYSLFSIYFDDKKTAKIVLNYYRNVWCIFNTLLFLARVLYISAILQITLDQVWLIIILLINLWVS